MNTKRNVLLEARSLTKQYPGGALALSDVSLSVHAGDIYGIVGLSGAGKSTLLRCLAGLVSPCTGEVRFHEENLLHFKGKKLRTFRSKIGMIFQHFNLLSSRTVFGNIGYPLEIIGASKATIRSRVEELLGLVGLRGKGDCYPAQLSGGEKQRVGIARALASHPEILFCDEATSALDPKTTGEILDLLSSINKKLGVTIILITHDMDVVKKICNQMAVMEGGKIVESGSVVDLFGKGEHPTTRHLIQGIVHQIPEEFFQNPSPCRKLLRLQFQGTSSQEPLISHIVKRFDVDANIVMGWIDRLRSTTVGTLILELRGTKEGIAASLAYLSEHAVTSEVVHESG